MDNRVNLSNLNDLQKVWLSDLAYIDINKEGYKKLLTGGFTLKEALKYIKNPYGPAIDVMFLEGKKFNFVMEKILGAKNKFPSKIDIVNTLIENGLGDLKIIHSSDYPTPSPSGFQALTFEDSYGNVGISYRGSDMAISSSTIREWLESNVLEYFYSNSPQAKEAVKYFQEHKTSDKNNYIYGHSLGGNLVSHVYLNCHEDIKYAFSINGTPIDERLIDTDEKQNAFNNKEKFSFNVICGDVIGQLKSCEKYKNNINYVKNNNTMQQSFLSAHMIQASSFDENGNFIKINEEEMKSQTNLISIKMINLSKFAREKMNHIRFKLVRENQYNTIINGRELNNNNKRR